MNQINIQNLLTENVSILRGVGIKIKKLLQKKRIEKISDLLLSFPRGFTDRSNIQTLNKLVIGKITTVRIKVIKYNFPRLRNLPNKVMCEDDNGKIEIIFFNSREGYIKKILPLNETVIVSGKINHFNKKYQITNPQYVVPLIKENYVNKLIPKYSLTEGLTEKVYRKLVDQVIEKITELEEWHNKDMLKKIGNVSFRKSVIYLHKNDDNDINSKYYRRLAYDEILSHLLVLSKVRQRIKKYKKKSKIFTNYLSSILIKNFGFLLSRDQKKAVDEINFDLKSEYKMFRILQGDVGTGKTIVSFLAAANTIQSSYQVVLLAPTEILARQHYTLAKKIFNSTNIKIGFLTGKIKINEKKIIYKKILNGEINFLIGTHAVFQKNVIF